MPRPESGPCPVLSRSIVLELMELETLIQAERGTLVSRLALLLGGDHHAAEDLTQEAFARAWRGLPEGLDRGQQRAWLHRTSRNLAVDELRRRRRRRRLMAPIEHLEHLHASAEEAGTPDAAREARARLSAHERFVLLLRFEAGFTHAEIAQLLDSIEEAARKRVSRARAAFLDAYRVARADAAPLVLVVVRDEQPAPYDSPRPGAKVATTCPTLSSRSGSRVSAPPTCAEPPTPARPSSPSPSSDPLTLIRPSKPARSK
jgi:RNA polymerase sigma factor (sigma-70 family)